MRKSKNLNSLLDLPETTVQRNKIIKKKHFLYDVYKQFYRLIASQLTAKNKKEKIVELGSGAGFIKKFIPHVITSDIIPLPKIDMNFSATRMPFKDNSINAFVMIDVFHHINNVEIFLKEADRCLKKDGQIIMIEPASTAFGRFIYKHFHHEPFRAHASWKFASTGPLSGANSALPWIVFHRDKKIFEKKFTKLKIVKLEAHTPLKYLLSGGFTLPQLLPDFFLYFINFLEYILKPLNRFIGLFYIISITKIK